MHTATHFDFETINLLANGGIGVGPTDTIYGLLALASNEMAVERVYDLRARDRSKPCIILIKDPNDLKEFGVATSYIERARPYWPASISLVLPTTEAPHHLLRGGDSLAFRLPNSHSLRKLISKTGPLIAPSANPAGQPPALSIGQAKSYFKENVDFYIGRSKPIVSTASVILRLDPDGATQLR